jgi:hypothetical protein
MLNFFFFIIFYNNFYNFLKCYNFKIEIKNVVINNIFFFNFLMFQKKYFTLKLFSQTE